MTVPNAARSASEPGRGYDPAFETELAPDLFAGARETDAIRAALQLPSQIRWNAARISLFTGAVLLSRRDAAREAATLGLRRALTGYGAVRDLFAGWEGRSDLHPSVRPLLAAFDPRGSGALDAIDAFGAVGSESLAAIDAGTALPPDHHERVMHAMYTTFHVPMLDAGARMEAAGLALRLDAEEGARRAQGRTNEARGRIAAIARTVRLISLNARVEAARAGEAGRAFGVIAEEIKSLSEQTAAVSDEMGESVAEMMSTLHLP